ncbi:LPD7 domain-containing protein [Legionella yabuuchiae]|uniref:LPD7 domain-containing protein n=1 Tax=Legionella yabuuchiae TaxID=376727 RepID=UPI001F5FA84D|nr:LPD7 domain-containing protein [Legionella yabuuchiae]
MHQNKTWADWLRHQAELGDKDALMALRYRNRKNQNQYSLSGVSSAFSSADVKQIDSITKEGTEIYKLGQSVIRNNGQEIKISKGVSIASLKKAIEMAKQSYGDCIQVNGSPLFKTIILQITAQNNIPITFADPEMETQRKKMISEQEKNDEPPRRDRLYDGRRTSRGDEVVGAAIERGQSIRKKPNPVIIRQGPPAKNQNSLRDLPQLDVVQLSDRGKMLLPDHAHDQLERKRIQFDNHVRRPICGLKSKGKNHKC